MKIKVQLIAPLFEKIEKGYEELRLELEKIVPEDALDLRALVHRNTRQLGMVKVSFSYMDQRSDEVVALRDQLRQLKLEFRFARRRLKRYFISQQRFRKIQEKRSHVSTIAA